MQFKFEQEIDQKKTLAVIFSDLKELDDVAENIKQKAEADKEFFAEEEGLRYYRQGLEQNADLYLLRIKEGQAHREMQKYATKLAKDFVDNSTAEDLQVYFANDFSDREKMQILKAFCLALPAFNAYSQNGYKALKDLENKEEKPEKSCTDNNCPNALADNLIKRAETFKLCEKQKLENIIVIKDQIDAEIMEELKALLSSIYLGRALVNEPANTMTPDELATAARLIGQKSGIEVDVMGKASIENLGMDAFLSVAKGSAKEPRLIVMRYRGAEDSEKVLALVGKGLMYDSGGYALKNPRGMSTMYSDMAGSAAVISAIRALAESKAKCNVTAIVAACENMVSGNAYHNGDIIGSMLGKKIEVANTDAEGRLTLADAVTYAWQREDADYIVDIATLTGAVYSALGNIMTGALSDDEKLWNALEVASEQSGDLVWRLPFHPEFAELNKSKRADIKNSGRSGAGTITAGHFVRAFTGEKPFLHLDIAGTAFLGQADERYGEGASGVGIELLYILAKEMFKKQ